MVRCRFLRGSESRGQLPWAASSMPASLRPASTCPEVGHDALVEGGDDGGTGHDVGRRHQLGGVVEIGRGGLFEQRALIGVGRNGLVGNGPVVGRRKQRLGRGRRQILDEGLGRRGVLETTSRRHCRFRSSRTPGLSPGIGMKSMFFSGTTPSPIGRTQRPRTLAGRGIGDEAIRADGHRGRERTGDTAGNLGIIGGDAAEGFPGAFDFGGGPGEFAIGPLGHHFRAVHLGEQRLDELRTGEPAAAAGFLSVAPGRRAFGRQLVGPVGHLFPRGRRPGAGVHLGIVPDHEIGKALRDAEHLAFIGQAVEQRRGVAGGEHVGADGLGQVERVAVGSVGLGDAEPHVDEVRGCRPGRAPAARRR